MDRAIPIIIACSYPILTQGMALLLHQQPGIEVAGTANSSTGLLSLIGKQLPQVVVTGSHLAEVDCATLTHSIKAAYPEVSIIVFGALEPEDTILSAIVAGAEGIVPLQADLSELLRAIRSVGSGKPYFSPQINKALSQGIHRLRTQHAATETTFYLLTPKEQQVLALICREFTTKEICQAMQLKPSTVDTHRKRLLEKTGAKNIAGLVLYAVKEGIINK